jgi:hypothetical protein
VTNRRQAAVGAVVIDRRGRITGANAAADALIRQARPAHTGPIVGAFFADLLPETLSTTFGLALADVRRNTPTRSFVMPSVYFPGHRLTGTLSAGENGHVTFTFRISPGRRRLDELVRTAVSSLALAVGSPAWLEVLYVA